MNNIKVLVVDDSAFMRKMIREILESDPFITVIDTARNGKEGVEKALALLPDVITLDVEMPIMNGIEALDAILQKKSVSVVMLSSLTKEGADSTIQALNRGAVDFIPKPSGSISLDIEKIKNEMIYKVKNAAKAKVKRETKSSSIRTNKVTHSFEPMVPKRKSTFKYRKKIVAIGVSTGGPRALQTLLTSLPKDFPAPILIVQHMPAGFTKSLAERLNKICDITVKEAEHGEFLQDGIAYIAPGNHHLSVKKLGTSITAYIDQTDPVGGHRPSVNYLFDSIVPLSNYQKTLVVLTGMGSDGSNGLQNIKQSDPNTKVIAESEETAIVFGMPKAAISTSLVDYVVPIDEIGNVLCKVLEE